MPGSILKFENSTLTAVSLTRDDTATLEFEPMMRIKSEGMPDVDPSTLWSQSVRITFLEAEANPETLDGPTTLIGGDLTVNGLTYRNIIPLPLDAPGFAEIELLTENGEKIVVGGERITVELLGAEKYLEHLHVATKE